jgi:hypothetical protein
MSRARLNVFLEREHAQRLAELATAKALSKSSLVAAALSAYLSIDGHARRDAAIARRVDRLSQQFDKLERDHNILIETVALYIRYFLSVSTQIPESQQAAARAQGKARFEQFVQQLGRHLQRGNSLINDVHREVYPEQGELTGNASGAPQSTAEEES